MRDLFMATLVVALLISGTSAQTGRIPLTDLGPGFYLGQFQGGLYEGGANAPPPDHASRGSSHAALIQRLNTSGQPSPIGRIVLISIGMSNTTQEFCSGVNGAQAYNRQFWYGLTGQSMKTCQPWTFGGQAWADPVVEKNALEVVDGAQSGMAAQEWGGEPRSGHGVPWPKVGQRLTAVGLSKQITTVESLMTRPCNCGC